MAGAAPVSVWSLSAELGEGPVWVERDSALWFTDIKKRKVHRYDPAGGARSSWDAPEQVGFVLPAESGGFVAGLQSGLHRFDPDKGGRFAPIVEVEPDLSGNRINDGTVDPAGRLWFGTMDDCERAPTGRFHRFDRGRLDATGLDRIPITNGPAFSPDGRILYWVDSLARTVGACSVAEDGNLGPSRPFVRIAPEDGYPDGPTVDSEGCVWIGVWGGWEARRYSPLGELVGRVRFPVANITKLAIGGPDLRTVFATTARQGLDAEALARQPEAGDLFAFQVDVPGLPGPHVAI